MVANLNTMVVYQGILTQENVGTLVEYCGIFITLAINHMFPETGFDDLTNTN